MIIRNNTKNGSPLSSVQKDSSQHPTYIPARRDLKDRLFKFIFGDPEHKEWTLALYNSIEHTSYDDPDDLEIVTLDNAVYMHMKNDVGVLVSSWNLAFWEHQSTLSANIPLRFLMYCSATMERYVYRHRLNLYGTRPLKIPFPKFYVFYNGKAETDRIREMKLSDLYYNDKEEQPMLDLKVIQYNINGYRNDSGSCRQLYEYQWFIEKIRSHYEHADPGTAVEMALDEMPEDFTIREWLWTNRSEVTQMSIFEFDDEYYRELFREEGLEEGIIAGEAKERLRVIDLLMKEGRSFADACSFLQLSEEETEQLKNYIY